mgnify:CR=1 FL=1
MKPSKNAVDLIKKFEGFKDKSYLCPAGLPTIGYGSTFWMDGSRVRLGQEISKENAEKLILWHLSALIEFIPKNVNQNQADALYSFIFNAGATNYNKSTLKSKILNNANDPTIRDEFNRWVYAKKNGQSVKLPGLVNRRKAEADLYFKPL